MVKKSFFIFKLKDAEGHERMYDLAMSDVFLAWNECSEKFIIRYILYISTFFLVMRLKSVVNKMLNVCRESVGSIFLYINGFRLFGK